ncbi:MULTISPECIES: aminoacyl-tRNA hydrolase [Glycomyces]|jgi:peptidyl-tRNA hydrolase, PTH1 family|uniref:Peptidyl-tRNA hydrolase n=2 Tax=Glycomyces TaxID=58113 RepID=A0A9X3PJM6_9ACTN|nr:aminoacyl-tRNA hydrolase [Glycomyces lechevalierae]MDA1384843.1 aminoacyl-tRNA hydrolase [Glycomyces lechevalierae]MDR7337705.1 PTH1 family peptidyl-tRNA hydrolase [Glycomyces lechevalierae]
MTDTPTLVVGLGNPGPKYAANRHNVGFMVVDALARRVGGRFAVARKARAEVCEARLGVGGPRVILVKPLTFMNLSGEAVGPLAQYFGVAPESVIAVHDELDVPFGELRLKRGGGEGGHNGLRSLTKVLGTKDYARVRFGIGRPPGRQDAADYVLKDFAKAERPEVDLNIELAADAVEAIIEKGFVLAQNAFNAAKRVEPEAQ